MLLDLKNLNADATFAAVVSVAGVYIQSFRNEVGARFDAEIWVPNEFAKSAFLAEYERFLKLGREDDPSPAYSGVQPLD